MTTEHAPAAQRNGGVALRPGGPGTTEARGGVVGDLDLGLPLEAPPRPRWPGRAGRHFVGGLLAAAPVAPVVAGVAAVALYVRPATVAAETPVSVTTNGTAPLATGAAILLGAWLLTALAVWLLGFTSADRASMGTYGEFTALLPELEAWARVARPPAPGAGAGRELAWRAAAHEIHTQLREIWREQGTPGARWVLGTGYITLWQRLHHAQEALIEVEPPEAVINHAHFDILRVQNSTIDNNDTYVRELTAAIDVLSRAAGSTLERTVAQLAATQTALQTFLAAGSPGTEAAPEASEALAAHLRQSREELSTLRERLAAVQASPAVGGVLAALDGLHLSPGDPPPMAALTALADGSRGLPALLGTLKHLRDAPARGAAPGAVGANGAGGTGLRGGLPAPGSVAEATAVVRTVRRMIHEFRDNSRAGLVRARNRLAVTVSTTGLAAYGVLCLAHAALSHQLAPGSAASHRPELIEAGLAYYLVGATVGLFSRLYTEANAETGVDDFGLSFARLLAAPLLAGIAGVLGVVVVAVATAVQTTTGTPAPVVSPLEAAFDLGRSPVNLVTAAVFGLTPGLLIDRLTQAGEAYKKDLKSSQSPGPATRAA